MATDIRIDSVNAPFPEEGAFSNYVVSRRIDVPALIAAGTLAATGLVSGTTYNIFNLPKNCILKGAFLFVRTVDAGGGTVTVVTAGGGTATYCTTLAVSTAGIVLPASGAGWTIANIAAFTTGAGTDIVNITIGTANITTAIFDVCAEVLKGALPYNAGSLAGSTGQ